MFLLQIYFKMLLHTYLAIMCKTKMTLYLYKNFTFYYIIVNQRVCTNR